MSEFLVTTKFFSREDENFNAIASDILGVIVEADTKEIAETKLEFFIREITNTDLYINEEEE